MSSPEFELQSVFGEPTLNPAGTNRYLQHKRYLDTSLSLLNFTNQDLTIGYRNGLVLTLPRQVDSEQRCLVIQTELRFPTLLEINATHLLSVLEEHCSAELRLVNIVLRPPKQRTPNNPYQTDVYGGVNLTIEYSISIAELKQFGGSVYFNDVDLMISQLPQEKAPFHPYSEMGMRHAEHTDLRKYGGGKFGFSVEIIDNQGAIGDRYLNFGGSVSVITATINPRKLDGIYINWNNSVKGRLDAPEANGHRYTAEQADAEFHLFRNFADAQRNGNGDLSRQEELTKLEHTNSLLKLELQTEKTKAERMTAELDAKLKALTFQQETLAKERQASVDKQNHLLEAERQKMRDHYESRSYERKDTSEVVKVLPAIIIGIGAIFMAVRAFMPTAK